MRMMRMMMVDDHDDVKLLLVSRSNGEWGCAFGSNSSGERRCCWVAWENYETCSWKTFEEMLLNRYVRSEQSKDVVWTKKLFRCRFLLVASDRFPAQKKRGGCCRFSSFFSGSVSMIVCGSRRTRLKLWGGWVWRSEKKEEMIVEDDREAIFGARCLVNDSQLFWHWSTTNDQQAHHRAVVHTRADYTRIGVCSVVVVVVVT